MELKGAVGIVTGASRGIGPVIARRLAGEGVRLALVARSEGGLREAAGRVARHGPGPLVVPADLRDEDAPRHVVDTVAAELGPPSLLVNNAGVERVGRFADADAAAIREIVLVNLVAAQTMTRMVLPHLLAAGRGHIVSIGSVGGRTAYPYGVANAAAKHGLVGFTWSLREELRGTGVGVSAVYPTLVSDVGISSRWRAGHRPMLLGRVSPDEVALAVMRCIRKDKVEITLAPPLLRASDVVSAVSPRLASWVARRAGVHAYLRRVADGEGS
ncbi:SDR family NAD(P)-dependent oxidoreductase [Actinomadura graeca]|uniref:SDR family NAD(P)-dependent oxidoreductase n=1 Tax=Actinomadura graeca TaxID=2750812 RepID=A0ABX8R264_9ACTN|nr:SDR family NAD(P)-dependent oxidoreductase [Actinomadura graeca]QXJ23787.1 SDR family NAD(P)-dependent oxidoreductase [Actinomadura graeca]